jgi:hypothetical protein
VQKLIFLLLGAFTKFLKVAVSFVMSARPFAWNNVDGWIFMKFDIGLFFGNMLRKIKSDKNDT